MEEERRRAPLEMNRHACQWPFGEPRSRDFHFCGKPVFENRPYCKEHLGRAMVKVSNKQLIKTTMKL